MVNCNIQLLVLKWQLVRFGDHISSLTQAPSTHTALVPPQSLGSCCCRPFVLIRPPFTYFDSCEHLVVRPRWTSSFSRYVSNTRSMGSQLRTGDAEYQGADRQVQLCSNGASSLSSRYSLPLNNFSSEYVIYFCPLGHGVSWCRRPTDWFLQDLVGLPLPDDAMQCRPPQDHPSGTHPCRRGRKLPSRCLNLAIQLSFQREVGFSFELLILKDAYVTIRFSEDMYAPESIDLLQKSGIDLQQHEEMGIEPNDFAELMITSGLVLLEDTKWISFHRWVLPFYRVFSNDGVATS